MQQSKRTKEQQRIFNLCLTGLMAAVIAVFTSTVKVQTGINGGYLHFGDSMVYLAGCIIGPYGIISSAIGGALADVLAGAPIWAIPTAVIKSLNCIPFVIAMHYYIKKKGTFKIINAYTVPMIVVSGLITIWGYFPVSGLLYSFEGAWLEIPSSIIQAVGSGAIFVIAGLALDAAKINKLLKR